MAVLRALTLAPVATRASYAVAPGLSETAYELDEPPSARASMVTVTRTLASCAAELEEPLPDCVPIADEELLEPEEEAPVPEVVLVPDPVTPTVPELTSF